MRIKRIWCKCYRCLVYLGITIIVGKFVLWMLIANSDIDKKEPTHHPTLRPELRRAPDDIVNAKFQDGAVCEEKRLPHRMLTKKDTWVPVDSKSSAYVFNAYLVDSGQAIVVIGAKTNHLMSVGCMFWYIHSNHTVSVIQESADHMRITEGRNLRYTAHMFRCYLKKHKIPRYISLVTSNCAKPLHLLPIQNASTPLRPERRFTVCLSPLHYNYSRAYELVEWIELNRILGAQKFIIYNHSLASNVASVLDLYTKRDITEVVQWRLPMESQKATSDEFLEDGEIYYFGQLSALNDCLYRQKHYSEFVVNIDVDEFIIPRIQGVNTWSDIMKHLKTEAGAYLFRNVFFRTDWIDNDIVIDNEEKVKKFKLITLQKLEREKKVFRASQRSKYFARTSNTTSLMIHSVRTLPRYPRVIVPEELALLHHYRDWQDHSNEYRNGKTEDRTVSERYSHVLTQNVGNIWSALPGITLE